MGLFWGYFRDTLRLPFTAKPGPLAMLAEGGADSLDPARDVILSLRDQFFPARCEDAFLLRFARSRGIVRAPLEPEEHWQARVRFAYRWWARGGRQSAMAEGLVLGFGFDTARVISLLAEDPARWASFRVEMTGGAGDILLRLDQIKWAINEVKPARSLLDGLRFYAPTQRLERHSGIAAQTGSRTIIYPWAPTDLTFEPAGAYHGATCMTGSITTIYPGDET